MSTWSVAEKRKLLRALRECGANNIAAIQKFLPDKTITEIRLAFENYTKLANQRINDEEKLRDEDSAINQWIKIIKKSQENTAVSDIVSRVLKYVALFEKRPNDIDVNLRDCYLALAEMSNGVVMTDLNSTTSYFFYQNLARLALKIKNSNDHNKRTFVKNMKSLDHTHKPQGVRTYNRKKKKVNVILNPLNIPDSLLKTDDESN
ncbi:uncharacterized protein LOC123015233 isoform X2 [Tribolium madens]|uniref:uncharacterized protein LOC123015233 isoform X2 n=1 Tax=Tribolium madens TaxID=41895 RepID=UPI001CF7449C|nr:uncharacterized protein LOC123015233 isoform X2 [Tribolium madens]XP_044270788.1 uncharacterized protein LOC123015233 isoform X2 [Tribolium madens]